MRLLTVLLFGMFLVGMQIFLVLKAMQNNLFDVNVDVVDALVERQTPMTAFLTTKERSWMEKHPVITVGIDPDFYPVEMFDAQGRHLGIAPDYLRMVQKLTGLTFRVAPSKDWTDTANKGIKREIDIYIAAAETDRRENYMLFTPSYISLPGIIVARQPAPGTTIPEIQNIQDLKGKRVAVVNRYSWHDFLEELHPEIIPVPVSSTLEGLQKLAFGEVDGMIDYQFNVTEKINSSGISNLRVAGAVDTPYGHAFGIRKDWPELHTILSKALERISPDERRIIAQKWLRPYEERGFSKQMVWLMLFAAEVVFAVFAFVLYWNFSLKRQVARRTAQLNQELGKYDRAEKALRESRAMLEQSNVELEHRVNERTRDLQAINAELQLAKEAADAATVAKSQFLANISHEVRTPLHGIMAFAELALLKEKTAPHRYLRAILQSSRALLEIINDLLDVSKIEAGHLELEQAPFMLDDVVHHVCTVAMHNAQAGGIELVVDMDPAMRLSLAGDAGRLQQIIMNLVTNAVKFTGPGGQICVSLRQGHAENLPAVVNAGEQDDREEDKEALAIPKDRVQIICFVRDTGVGIAPEFLGQLFQPFRQVDASTTRRHGGTGLGLCICRQLVEMMHGEIWVESEPGVGSTFAFSIPFVTQSRTTEELSASRESRMALVLSASPMQTEVLCRHFNALGIEPRHAASTDEAIRICSERMPDMVFLDRKLLEPDTLSALRIMRSALGRALPAIVMDEHAGEQILSEPPAEGGVDGGQEEHTEQIAILPIITLRGLREAVASLDEPGAYTGRHPSLPGPMETPLFQDVHILVAEDNPTNQEIMEALFEDTGVRLTVVSNGKQAIDALCAAMRRKEHIDLVLMDVQMPVMDGYEATRIIRTMPELDSLPIVAITAHAMHEDKMRALSAGIARYLSKPLSRAALFGTLKNLLPHKIRTREEAEKTAPMVLPQKVASCLDAAAIERLNVPPATYQKIVRGFVRNTAEALPAMRRLIFLEENGQWTALPSPVWDTLIREAHNLKGAAANIGATSVQLAARELEFAARNHSSAATRSGSASITALFTPLFEQVENAFAAVRSMIEEQDAASEAQQTPPPPLMEGAPSTAAMETLRNALSVADPDRIVDALAGIESQLSPQLRERLQQFIDSYDYDEALALISNGANHE